MKKNKETAIFGGGCFWCTEAIFSELRGVLSVIPGYSGGYEDSPTYESVCAGNTGHAEVVKVEFNPAVISYRNLLEVFFALHDPTTKNRQGNDVGIQYRSVIFYMNGIQEEEAKKYLSLLESNKASSRSIVTELEPFKVFFPAKEYHKNYYKTHANEPYCAAVISPKLEKLRKMFAHDVKS